jgi:hypothetical protein
MDRDIKKFVFVYFLKMRKDESINISEKKLNRLIGIKFNGRKMNLNREFEKSSFMSDGV